MDVLRLVLIGALVAVATVLALEAVRRKRLAALISPSQFWIRVAAALVMILELVLILAGTYLLAGASPLLQIFYWTGCLILAFLLIVLAILDVRGLLVNYLVERRRIFPDRSSKRSDDRSSH